jgi:hypothetical protein
MAEMCHAMAPGRSVPYFFPGWAQTALSVPEYGAHSESLPGGREKAGIAHHACALGDLLDDQVLRPGG